MKSYHVMVWNEDIIRGYTILADSRKEAKERAIKAELERHTPFYKIHIESIRLWDEELS